MTGISTVTSLELDDHEPNGRSRRPLRAEEVALLDEYWRAANYLSVGQIYLMDNPLLTEPLRPEHIKPRLLGHWGTTPGLNLVYVHLNRVIKERDLNAMLVVGPGHGGPGIVANVYLEGTYSEVYPEIDRTTEGLRRLVRQFSFPGGIPSHVAPQTPGSIHEGGELGYSLVHAYGAVFDNPDLLVTCVIGDGEAETGPLAASWHSNKFVNPAQDGAVLPILHLNGYKIANPTLLARIPDTELVELLRGYGHRPIVVAGDDPAVVHQALAAALDEALDDIRLIQTRARAGQGGARPTWPMIVLRTPKGWTGPRVVDGLAVEGTWRAHQVPLANVRTDPSHLAQLEAWMRSYRPQELFTGSGALRDDLAALPPSGHRRMGANPHANGGILLQDLSLPDFREHAVDATAPGATLSEATKVAGAYLADVVRRNPTTFRVMGPDETASNRLTELFEATGRAWDAITAPGDDHLAADGRVMEVLSEHLCQGWLEGYLLTGRHGLFNCYEAFIHIVDSMFNQHAKWLKVSGEVPWRRPIASLNYLLSSHVWRQDNNGFSHQDPGFIDHIVNKKAEIVRVYLPPDTNTLLVTVDHCLRSRNYVNLVVAGKQPALTYLPIQEAELHCARGLGIWEWASNDADELPDVVMACAGDVPTLETLAAVAILRERIPQLRVRVVNVVDLMRLEPDTEHPHGLPDEQFDALFTTDRPVVFAFHGYAALIHRLTYRRTNHHNIHVRGYREEGTTTTPFDMVMMNDLDRYHLVTDVIDRVPSLRERMAHLRQDMLDARARVRAYTREHGEDPRRSRRGRGRRPPPAVDVRLMVALGGNALLERRDKPDAAVQRHHIRRAAAALAPLAVDHQLIVCHGNGPQVGLLALESETDKSLSRPYPLDALGAQTQGMIGYWLTQELHNAGVTGPVITVITQTLVAADDPAFNAPSKFIGRTYTHQEAKRLAARHGWSIAADGAAWRRVVASPQPDGIVEQGSVRRLIDAGAVVVCGGGGGAPVVRHHDGQLSGVEAVVDKDLTAMRIALDMTADRLLLLTDVPAVMRDFGTPRATALRRLDPADVADLDLPAGSMAPKVDACVRFTVASGKPSAIGALTDAAAVLAGTSGTTIGDQGGDPVVVGRGQPPERPTNSPTERRRGWKSPR